MGDTENPLLLLCLPPNAGVVRVASALRASSVAAPIGPGAPAMAAPHIERVSGCERARLAPLLRNTAGAAARAASAVGRCAAGG